jgi:hypothetical protein
MCQSTNGGSCTHLLLLFALPFDKANNMRKQAFTDISETTHILIHM